MKKMFLALLCSYSLYAQDTLTVEKAVQQVLQTHPAIEQASANVRAAEARYALSRSAQAPNISALAQYTRIGPIPSVIFGPENFMFAPDNNYDGHISADYTVYDFGKTGSSVDLAQSRTLAARDAIDLTRISLALQTIRTFYSIVYLQSSIIVQEEQIAALNQHLGVIQKRVMDGSATQYDVLTTRTRVAAAENQKVDIQNALEKQQSLLRQLLGSKSDNPVPLRGTFTEAHVALDYDSLVDKSHSLRAEMKIAHDAEQTAFFQQRLSELSDMPSLNIYGSYGIKNGYEPDLDSWRGNWAVGAVAAIPIFNGNRTEHQIEEAKAMLEAEQAHTANTVSQIRSEVEQAIADVHAMETKVEISKVQLQQAHEAVVIARTRYETGSITNLDLLDAENAESAAKLTNLQALFQFTLSKYNLQQATGSLLSR